MRNLFSPLDQFYVLPLEHASKIVDFSFFFQNNLFLSDISIEYRWLGFLIGAFSYGLLDKQIYLQYPYIWLTDNISYNFLANNIVEGLSQDSLIQLIELSKQKFSHALNRSFVFDYMTYTSDSIFETSNLVKLSKDGSFLGFLGIWLNFIEGSGDLAVLYKHCLNYPTYVGAYSSSSYPADFLFNAFEEILNYDKELGMLFLNNVHQSFLEGNLEEGFNNAENLLNRWQDDVKTGLVPTYDLILGYFSEDGSLTASKMKEDMANAENVMNTKFKESDKNIILNFLHSIPLDDFTQITRVMFANAHVYLSGFFDKGLKLSEGLSNLNVVLNSLEAKYGQEEMDNLLNNIISNINNHWITIFFFKVPRSYNLAVPFEALHAVFDTVEEKKAYYFSYAYSFANDFASYFSFLENSANSIQNKLVMDSTVPSFTAVNVADSRNALLILLTDNILSYANYFLGLTDFAGYGKSSSLVVTSINPYVGSLVANAELFFMNSTLGLFSITAMIFLAFVLYNIIFVDVRHINSNVVKDEYVKDTTYAQFLIPNYTRYIAEQLYRLLLTITLGNIIDKNAKYFFPTIFVTFHVVLFFNLYGMLPLSFTFTSLFVITFTMSLWLFVGLNIVGLAKNRTGFFGLFIPSNVPTVLIPFLVVLETISYFFRVISVSVRLFANMMAGHTLLKVLSTFVMGAVMNTSKISPVVAIIPLLLGTGLLVIIIGLEVAVAFIQAYVFTVLFSVYINDALQGGH